MQAISMRENRYGFLEPVVDLLKCVSCGACQNACPAMHPQEADVQPECFAARSNDERLVKDSTSGAIFTELAKPIIRDGGVVFGCVFDAENLIAYHKGATSLEQLEAMRGSKYVQSDMRNVIREVLEAVRQGRKVLFTGTPCQVAAVNRVVGPCENLLTVDLICHSVPSPSLLKRYLRRLEKNAGSRVRSIKFRKKTPSWRRFHINVEYVNGQDELSQPYFENEYYRAFLGKLRAGDACGRESCYHCSHKSGSSGADITIGDFWGIEYVLAWNDDDRGVSAVVVHTEKGRRAFCSLESVTSVGVRYEDLVRNNQAYFKSANCRGSRRLFQWLLRYMRPQNADRVYAIFSMPKRILRRVVPIRVRSFLKKGN